MSAHPIGQNGQSALAYRARSSTVMVRPTCHPPHQQQG